MRFNLVSVVTLLGLVGLVCLSWLNREMRRTERDNLVVLVDFLVDLQVEKLVVYLVLVVLLERDSKIFSKKFVTFLEKVAMEKEKDHLKTKEKEMDSLETLEKEKVEKEKMENMEKVEKEKM